MKRLWYLLLMGIFLTGVRAKDGMAAEKCFVLRYLGESGALTYYLTEERTVVGRDRLMLVIDYGKKQLCRYDEDGDTWRTYVLAGDGKEGRDDDRVRFAAEKLFGTPEILSPGSAGGAEKGWWKEIIWGNGATLHRTAAPVRVGFCGMEFGRERIRYRVAAGDGDLNRFYGTRQPVFARNPLLRRVDILGVYDVLQGYPRMMERENGERLELKDHGVVVPDEMPAVPSHCFE